MVHGRRASDERLYLKVEDGGRELKSMNDAKEDAKVRVACYMASKQHERVKLLRMGSLSAEM